MKNAQTSSNDTFAVMLQKTYQHLRLNIDSNVIHNYFEAVTLQNDNTYLYSLSKMKDETLFKQKTKSNKKIKMKRKCFSLSYLFAIIILLSNVLLVKASVRESVDRETIFDPDIKQPNIIYEKELKDLDNILKRKRFPAEYEDETKYEEIVGEYCIYRYISTNKLPAGGFSTNYRGIRFNLLNDAEDFEEVAIKQISNSKLQQTELDIIKKVQHHENIIELKAIIIQEEFTYIVTELCIDDLFENMRDPTFKLDDPTRKKYLKQIVHGMKHIHAKNIIHRDLKLENILLGKNDTLKITDFGFSYDVKEAKGDTVGFTPAYIAPEQTYPYMNYHTPKQDDGILGTYKTDVWTLGCILYLLVKPYPAYPTTIIGYRDGMLLFDFTDFAKMETNQAWNKLCDELKHLLRRMLDPDPNKRIELQNILYHPWLNKFKKDDIVEFKPKYRSEEHYRQTYVVLNVTEDALLIQEKCINADNYNEALTIPNKQQFRLMIKIEITDIVQFEAEYKPKNLSNPDPQQEYVVVKITDTTIFLTKPLKKNIEELKNMDYVYIEIPKSEQSHIKIKKKKINKLKKSIL